MCGGEKKELQERSEEGEQRTIEEKKREWKGKNIPF